MGFNSGFKDLITATRNDGPYVIYSLHENVLQTSSESYKQKLMQLSAFAKLPHLQVPTFHSLTSGRKKKMEGVTHFPTPGIFLGVRLILTEGPQTETSTE